MDWHSKVGESSKPPKLLSLSLSKNRKITSYAPTPTVDLESAPPMEGKGKKAVDLVVPLTEVTNASMPKSDSDFMDLDEQATTYDNLDNDDDFMDDKLWRSSIDMEERIQHNEKPAETPDLETLDQQTPRLEQLSVSEESNNTDETPSTVLPAKRKMVGEDVFTRNCVKTWQASRIKAWEGRYLNPEGYYYRFVTPGEGQQNGGWSKSEHVLFMKRYDEWVSRGWKIGASWGLFSKGIPHRVGYQCMNYYRKLVSENKLQDESYAVVDGKLKQIHKERAPAGEVPTTDLGPEWKEDEVKAVEKDVDAWLKEFHNRSGCATVRSIAPPKPKAAPRVAKSISTKRSPLSDLMRRQPVKRSSAELDDDNDFLLESTEPEIAHLRIAPRDWEAEWKEKLQHYQEFMKSYLDKETREAYWHAKQAWRRGLATTEMLLRNKNWQKTAPSETETVKPQARTQQASLSRFFAGVKKLKIDTPDELISNVRIPNDLYSGVKQITPLSVAQTRKTNDERIHYYELEDIKDCLGVLDAVVDKGSSDETHQSPLEGILVDPPWEFYVKDGRNDGHCHWNLQDVASLLEKVLDKMTAGLVFVWVHKLIQADVVRMMYTLGCKYVENLVWFKKSINNVQLDQPSPYFSSAKEILLMFKKGDGFELRHQRSPDVIIDFELPRSQWIDQEFTEPKPTAVYDMIETLLPKAGYDEALKRGRLLELWAKKASPRREGWVAFHQRKNTTVSNTQISWPNDCIHVDDI